MKQLYKNIILFLLPVLLLVILLPVNERSKFLGLQDDCFNHGIWIYDRISQNKQALDIVFFGTSKTVNGIHDELIQNEMAELNMQVVNLGYCRAGRNFSYSLLKKLLKNKHPKQLILEVREDEDRYSHPIFPHIATTNEVIFAHPFFNRDMVSDIYTHLGYKIELTQDLLYEKIPDTPISQELFGYACSPDTASSEMLYQIKQKRSQPKADLSEISRDFYMQFPRKYLKKIHRICAAENIELSFLYFPSYGSPFGEIIELETYRQYGNILYPPAAIFEDPDNWFDEDHFNQAGAEKLSEWLAEQLLLSFN